MCNIYTVMVQDQIIKLHSVMIAFDPVGSGRKHLWLREQQWSELYSVFFFLSHKYLDVFCTNIQFFLLLSFFTKNVTFFLKQTHELIEVFVVSLISLLPLLPHCSFMTVDGC